jgi:copper(I)-binding protein
MKTFRISLAGATLALAALAAAAHSFKLGEITIGHPYARTTAPGQSTGGAYLRFENRGADDRLVAVSTPVAQAIELHDTQMDGDVMRMRQVQAIAVPANKPVVLKPGGLHIMLVGLKAPLKKGDSFPLTLKFEKAGEVTVQVNVEAAKAEPMKHDMKH